MHIVASNLNEFKKVATNCELPKLYGKNKTHIKTAMNWYYYKKQLQQK